MKIKRIIATLLMIAGIATISSAQRDIQAQFESAIRNADFSLIKDYGWKDEIRLNVAEGLITRASSVAIDLLNNTAKGFEIESVTFSLPANGPNWVSSSADISGPGERTYHFACKALKEGDQLNIELVTLLETTGNQLLELIEDDESIEEEPMATNKESEPSASKKLETKYPDDMVYIRVDLMPAYPGCEEKVGDRRRECSREKVSEYISANINYPEQAKAEKQEGTVYVYYEIGKAGKVQNAKVIRGVCESLDKAALDIVNSIPQHEPGMQQGVALTVRYTVPVKFEL